MFDFLKPVSTIASSITGVFKYIFVDRKKRRKEKRIREQIAENAELLNNSDPDN